MGGAVGAMVGLAEGAVVSTALGLAVGPTVGAALGFLVLVGLALLGTLVGSADTVGAEVGLLLGWAEGCEVGAWTVGDRVGTAVGGTVCDWLVLLY